MNKIKEFFKENIRYIITLIVCAVVFTYPLPYYISSPGGTIDITNRIEVEGGYETTGSLNLLYVSELRGNVVTCLLGLILNYDIEPEEEMQISNETTEEINKRNKIMLESSIDSATFVAYKYANKSINITSYKNIVLANYRENGLKVGDIITKIDGTYVSNITEIKELLNNKEANTTVLVGLIRNDKDIEVEVVLDNDKKMGTLIQTDYEYELDPKIEVKFKQRESGSSGGLMLALSIYNAISGEDITKGLRIAGTGTIDMNGNVGEIAGVKYKIMGAYRNKVDLVFVPSENYEEAMQVVEDKNYDMKIVKVSTFDEALNYLKSL